MTIGLRTARLRDRRGPTARSSFQVVGARGRATRARRGGTRDPLASAKGETPNVLPSYRFDADERREEVDLVLVAGPSSRSAPRGRG